MTSMFAPTLVFCQGYVDGFIFAKDAQPIERVLIICGDYATTSDEQGYFSITAACDSIQVLSLLYKDTTLTTERWSSRSIIVLDDIELPQALILSNKSTSTQPGNYFLQASQLAAVPAPLGETDVLRALQSLPAIASGSEGTVAPQIRGSEASQTLILLDGVPIYSPTVFFGYQGAINFEMIRDVNVYTSNIPSRYGGRSAGVLDFTSRTGNAESHKRKLTVGFPNAGFVMEGPVSKRVTYFSAGRVFYLLLPTFIADNKLFQGDVFGKLSLRADYWVHNLSIFGNLSGVKNNGNEAVANSRNTIRRKTGYGNLALSWKSAYARGPFRFQTRLVHSRYGTYVSSTERNGDSRELVEDVHLNNAVRTPLLNVSSSLDKRFGLFELGFDADGTLLESTFKANPSEEETVSGYNEHQYVLSPYVSYQIPTYKIFYGSLGLRTPIYVRQGQKRDINFEPRIYAGVRLSPTVNLSASFNRLYQNFHQFGSPTSIGDFESYRIPTQVYKRSYNTQYTLDLSSTFLNDHLQLASSFYFKKLSGLVQAVNSSSPIGSTDLNSPKGTVTAGSGQTSGIELSGNFTVKNFQARLSYAYSRSFRRFDEINFGEWFPYRWDRPHRGTLLMSLAPKDSRWTFSSQSVFESGYAFTRPIGISSQTFFTFLPRDIGDRSVLIYDQINSGRSKTMQRVDLSAKRSVVRVSGRTTSWTLSLYNALGRRNPTAVFIEPTRFFDYQLIETTRSVYRFIPGVQYSILW